ncbi:MAG: TrkH family potassium uptake protein [Lachnospiraceae bacterium]|jgi:trk system potassium uptake protein TrkH|nr:TrkH family potassium uptake protein [Lachnospiraceae bacterium]
MNLAIVVYFLGWIMNLEALLMALPLVTGLIYREADWVYFGYVMLALATVGYLCTRKKPKNELFFAKEGFVCVSLGWVILSFFGSLPFYLSGAIGDFEDAMFEIISGFTTTGASVLADVEALSHSMLMWRSFTHWIGGMGVLVFILAIMPLAGSYNMHIMRAESPGPSVGKLVPRVKTTAKLLYIIYFSMTVAEVIALLIGGMPLFDAMCASFGTAGTGGFGIKALSMGYYDSAYLQGVVSVFMLLFGVNFNVYYLFLIRKPKDALRCEEARVYFAIVAASTALIAWNARHFFAGAWPALHHALFQVASIITTTGYSTVDFNLWPQFSKMILVALMFVGACAGSTGGGMKVSRILIGVKSVYNELASLVHPRSVKVVKLEHKAVEATVVRSVNAYFVVYFIIFAVSLLLISLDDFDFTTNFTAISATFNNIGPGLSMVGPMGSFGSFSPFSKVVMMFDMLAGRLEIFPMILLFLPSTWKKS